MKLTKITKSNSRNNTKATILSETHKNHLYINCITKTDFAFVKLKKEREEERDYINGIRVEWSYGLSVAPLIHATINHKVTKETNRTNKKKQKKKTRRRIKYIDQREQHRESSNLSKLHNTEKIEESGRMGNFVVPETKIVKFLRYTSVVGSGRAGSGRVGSGLSGSGFFKAFKLGFFFFFYQDFSFLKIRKKGKHNVLPFLVKN